MHLNANNCIKHFVTGQADWIKRKISRVHWQTESAVKQIMQHPGEILIAKQELGL